MVQLILLGAIVFSLVPPQQMFPISTTYPMNQFDDYHLRDGVAIDVVDKQANALFKTVAQGKSTFGDSDIIYPVSTKLSVFDEDDLNNWSGNFKRSRRRKRFIQSKSKWDTMVYDKDINQFVLRLKWYISNYTKDMPREDVRYAVEQSFSLWSTSSALDNHPKVKLEFEEASKSSEADIDILWAYYDHGDAYKFDGLGTRANILAHTFYPTYQVESRLNGDIHLDDAEYWTMDGSSGGVSFWNVFIHEVGHSLGLGHSKQPRAVMYPIYKSTPVGSESFDTDDKCALIWNYIGANDFCFFVWLMNEVVIRQKEAREDGSISGKDDYGGLKKFDDLSGNKEKVESFKQRLQDSPLHECDKSGSRRRLEHQMIKKLDLSMYEAHKYGDVVCNFFNGLNVYAKCENCGDYNTTLRMAEEYFRDLSFPSQKLSRKRRHKPISHHKARGQRRPDSFLFNPNFYNSKFFDNFLTMYLQ